MIICLPLLGINKELNSSVNRSIEKLYFSKIFQLIDFFFIIDGIITMKFPKNDSSIP